MGDKWAAMTRSGSGSASGGEREVGGETSRNKVRASRKVGVSTRKARTEVRVSNYEKQDKWGDKRANKWGDQAPGQTVSTLGTILCMCGEPQQRFAEYSPGTRRANVYLRLSPSFCLTLSVSLSTYIIYTAPAPNRKTRLSRHPIKPMTIGGKTLATMYHYTIFYIYIYTHHRLIVPNTGVYLIYPP